MASFYLLPIVEKRLGITCQCHVVPDHAMQCIHPLKECWKSWRRKSMLCESNEGSHKEALKGLPKDARKKREAIKKLDRKK